MKAKKSILLIEDNNFIRENLCEYFELEGYIIIAANNGISGIKLAEEFPPDLIICDVLMTKMSGYEVLNILLTTPKTFEIPFIFSTSNSEKVDKEEALKLGADDYIVKPFDPETLLKMVNTLLLSGSKRRRSQ